MCIETQRFLARNGYALLDSKTGWKDSFIRLLKKVDDKKIHSSVTHKINEFEKITDYTRISEHIMSKSDDVNKYLLYDKDSFKNAFIQHLKKYMEHEMRTNGISQTNTPDEIVQKFTERIIIILPQIFHGPQIYDTIRKLLHPEFNKNNNLFKDWEPVLGYFFQNFRYTYTLKHERGGGKRRNKLQIHTGPNGGKYTINPKTKKKRYIKK